MMGDIVAANGLDQIELRIDIATASPIERIEIRDGREVIEVIEPWRAHALDRRLRIVWSGAEYRGRFRMTTWDGELAVTGNTIERVTPINFFNPDRPLRQISAQALAWSSITTGNFAGLDIVFKEPGAGSIQVKTPHATIDESLARLIASPLTRECGALDRKLEAYALPLANDQRRLSHTRTVAPRRDRDSAIYVCVRTEDGHQAWSSPIYVVAR